MSSYNFPSNWIPSTLPAPTCSRYEGRGKLLPPGLNRVDSTCLGTKEEGSFFIPPGLNRVDSSPHLTPASYRKTEKLFENNINIYHLYINILLIFKLYENN